VTIDVDAPFQISDAAKAAERSIYTIRRWEKLGLIPKARRSAGGLRRYSAEDITQIKKAAERPLPSDEPTSASKKAWTEIQPESDPVRPWSETVGAEAKLPAVPSECDCGRTLTRIAVTDAHGRRWLNSHCSQHGQQGRQRW
jgi:hypothetical protein